MTWVGPLLRFSAGLALGWLVLGLMGYTAADVWVGGLLFAVLFGISLAWDCC